LKSKSSLKNQVSSTGELKEKVILFHKNSKVFIYINLKNKVIKKKNSKIKKLQFGDFEKILYCNFLKSFKVNEFIFCLYEIILL
jgi:hypothetical protein